MSADHVHTTPPEAQRVVIRAADQPGDLGWIVQEHGEQYAAELGWDQTFEGLVARIVADYAAGHDLVGQNWALDL